MANRDYSLERFDSARAAATHRSWRKHLDASPDDYNVAVFERRLALITADCDYENGTQFCYGIFPQGSNVATAITEIAYTRQSTKWIKMLNLHLGPQLDLSVDRNEPDFSALSDVFTAAIVGSVMLSGVHQSRVIKLYARTPVLLAFFRFVAQQLPARLSKRGGAAASVKVSIEGRWLVLKV